MDPKARAWDRAREAFEKASEGMSEDEITEHIQRIVHEVRAERAAMRDELAKWSTTNSATTSDLIELDIFYSTLT